MFYTDSSRLHFFQKLMTENPVIKENTDNNYQDF